MLKKVMSAVLAGIMTLALAVPVLASSTPTASNPYSTDPKSSDLSSEWFTGSSANAGIYTSSDGNGNGLQEGEFTTEYTSETKVPYLDVVITGNGGLILNPYRVDYSSTTVGWGGDPSAAWNLYSSAQGTQSAVPPSADNQPSVTTNYGAEQIISTDITITSKTIVPVLVGAKVKVKIEQGDANAPTANQVSLTSSNIPAADQAKSAKKVCLWLGAGADHDAAIANGRNATNSKKAADSFNCKNWLLCSQAISKDKNGNTVENWNNNARMFMIPKYVSGSGQKCVLTFGGEMVQQPLDNPWVPGDKITPTMVINLQIQKNYGMPQPTST